MSIIQYFSFRFYLALVSMFLIIGASVIPLVLPPRCYVRPDVNSSEVDIERTRVTPCFTDLGAREIIDEPYIYAFYAYWGGVALSILAFILLFKKVALDFPHRNTDLNFYRKLLAVSLIGGMLTLLFIGSFMLRLMPRLGANGRPQHINEIPSK